MNFKQTGVAVVEFLVVTGLTIGSAAFATHVAKNDIKGPAPCEVKMVKAANGPYTYRQVIDDGKGYVRVANDSEE